MPIFRKDPCGLVCVLFTYVAILYADYVITYWVALQAMPSSIWGTIHVLLFNVISFLAIMAHMRSVFSDPGMVPLPKSRIDFSDMYAGSTKKDEDWTVCGKCEMYRPPRAHHCRICQRCIRRMDHHCPWINNCVGEWNQKFFIQFLMFVGAMSSYAISLTIYSWMRECTTCSEEMMVKQTRLMHSVILAMECLLFGLFVMAILWDQFEAIFADETAVEQVKRQGPYRSKRSKFFMLKEVCGRSHPCLWIFPCTNNHKGSESTYVIPI